MRGGLPQNNPKGHVVGGDLGFAYKTNFFLYLLGFGGGAWVWAWGDGGFFGLGGGGGWGRERFGEEGLGLGGCFLGLGGGVCVFVVGGGGVWGVGGGVGGGFGFVGFVFLGGGGGGGCCFLGVCLFFLVGATHTPKNNHPKKKNFTPSDPPSSFGVFPLFPLQL